MPASSIEAIQPVLTPGLVEQPSIRRSDSNIANVSHQDDLLQQPAEQMPTRGIEDGQATVLYSAFTIPEKRVFVLCAGLAAMMSPMASQIYYPSLNEIAVHLRVSNELVNLTMTTYLIMQGLSPAFVGSLSDHFGRRSAYLVCFVLFMASNVGLGLQSNYAALMVLRCIQSAGSSPTVALANAVVSDLVPAQQRGAYVGFMSIAPQAGPTLGPVIGGLLAQFLGWHSIFWFLLILSAAIFVVVVLLLAETCRNVVDDGSISPPHWLRCLLNTRVDKRVAQGGRSVQAMVEKKTELTEKRSKYSKWPNPWESIKIIFTKQAGFILIYIAIVFSSNYAVIALIPSQFGEIYDFNELQIALCYIPFGVGCVLAAFTRGIMIDSAFRRHAKRLGYRIEANRAINLDNFPIERARIELAIPPMIVGCACTIVFGWLLQTKVNLAGPLVLLFVIGFCENASVNALQVLLIDIHPGKAARAMAASNLCRCLIGAGGNSAVLPLIKAVGIGWTMVIFGLLPIFLSPTLYYVSKNGPRWRRTTVREIAQKAERG